MEDKDPTNWTGAVWLLAIGAAMIGGVLSCYAKSLGKKLSAIQLFLEWLTSSLLGLMVFMLMASFDFREGLCAFAACITASMSTSLLSVIQAKVKSKIEGL